MSTWPRLAPEWRALASLLGALATFVPVFLWAPADDWRVVAVAVLVGALTACLCWQHFPGWDLFVAGCAFAVAGSVHPLLPSDWTRQATLLLPAAAAWYAGARLAETWLVFPLGYEDRSPFGGSDRLLRELGRGARVTLAVGLVGWLLLTLLLEAAGPLALPLSAGLTLWADRRWPVHRPLWAVLGLLVALPAAGASAAGLADLLQRRVPAAEDPWLVGGLSIVGSLFGLWFSRWRRAATRAQGPEAPPENPIREGATAAGVRAADFAPGRSGVRTR
jgi:hypothetical protein